MSLQSPSAWQFSSPDLYPIVLAIVFSGIVSVTLTPMLCARLLKPEGDRRHNRLYEWSERAFERMRDAYDRSLHWSVDHRPIIFVVFLVIDA